MSAPAKHPLIYWAQRSANLLLTVEVDDMNVSLLKIEGNKFHIKGTNKEGVTYEAELELYDEIKNEPRQIPTTRHVELIIPKEKEEWWPRLLKSTTKAQWIKVDFNKWVDEDEENEAAALPEGMNFDFGAGGNDFDFNSMMGGANGLADMPEGEDDDEEDMPELADADEEEKPTTSSA